MYSIYLSRDGVRTKLSTSVERIAKTVRAWWVRADGNWETVHIWFCDKAEAVKTLPVQYSTLKSTPKFKNICIFYVW